MELAWTIPLKSAEIEMLEKQVGISNKSKKFRGITGWDNG